MVLNSGTSTDVVRNTATINGRVQNTLFGYALLSRYVVTSRLRGQEVRRNSIEEFLRRYARHLNTGFERILSLLVVKTHCLVAS